MLGEIIGEFQGKITSQRVLPSDGTNPKVETSVHMTGKFLGIDATNIVTYWTVMRSMGPLYGEANGIIMTKDGDVLTYIAHGVGKFTGYGSAASFRGDNYIQVPSEKFTRLNSVAIIFEYEVDDDGNTQAKLWEWKQIVQNILRQ